MAPDSPFASLTGGDGGDALVKKILAVDSEDGAKDKPEDDPEALAKQKIQEKLDQLHADLELARDGRTEDNIPVNPNEPYWDKRNALQRYLHELKG